MPFFFAAGCVCVEGSSNGKGWAWVKWDKVLSEFKNGGLNVGSLSGVNWGLIGKCWWRFMSGQETLWIRVIKSIFGAKDGLEEGVFHCGSGKSA